MANSYFKPVDPLNHTASDRPILSNMLDHTIQRYKSRSSLALSSKYLIHEHENVLGREHSKNELMFLLFYAK